MAKKGITLDHIDHYDTRRMEYFLNGLDEELSEVPIDWKGMVMADRLSGVCKFVSTTSKTPFAITVYFCNGYADALEIGRANLLPSTSSSKWSINGSLMYLVETEDRERLSDILSYFAGKE